MKHKGGRDWLVLSMETNLGVGYPNNLSLTGAHQLFHRCSIPECKLLIELLNILNMLDFRDHKAANITELEG